MSSDFETYYAHNPVSTIDQNKWTDRDAEVSMQFRQMPVVYTPLVDWVNRSQITGADDSVFTDLLDTDTNVNPIGMTAQYIEEPLYVDSRARRLGVNRYGDKVQLHKSSNLFQMWKMSGGRNWQPLLRGVLGKNVVQKIELLSRNSFMTGDKSFWTYAGGGTSFADLDSSSIFDLGIVNEWNLRLGNLGSPVIPNAAGVKVAIVPPGIVYDFMKNLPSATSSEASLWRDATLYSGQALKYEIGATKNTRFVEAPSDRYGINPAVLYNSGEIEIQAGITAAINPGDGSPDPEAMKVDGVWEVGQKAVTHYIQLSNAVDASGNPVVDMSKFAKNDMVTIHTARTNYFGITNGVDPRDGKTIVRRIVDIDAANFRLSFDRPIMSRYTSLSGGVYGYVTKGRHVGMTLVLGSRGCVVANVNQPISFYEPDPIDDFKSVWRYVWDMVGGFNMWEPSAFELHFSSISLGRPGGVISA